MARVLTWSNFIDYVVDGALKLPGATFNSISNWYNDHDEEGKKDIFITGTAVTASAIIDQYTGWIRGIIDLFCNAIALLSPNVAESIRMVLVNNNPILVLSATFLTAKGVSWFFVKLWRNILMALGVYNRLEAIRKNLYATKDRIQKDLKNAKGADKVRLQRELDEVNENIRVTECGLR